jgi:prepilin-type N-terminal cleavage/methylation domain-containing protein
MRGLRSTKGFTLIELLIVVVIIGILATVLISRFSGVKDSAYLAHCNTLADQIKLAAMAYTASRIDGAIPDEIADLELIDPDIAPWSGGAEYNHMTVTVAGDPPVATIDHGLITEATKAAVNLKTGVVTPASLTE